MAVFAPEAVVCLGIDEAWGGEGQWVVVLREEGGVITIGVVEGDEVEVVVV